MSIEQIPQFDRVKPPAAQVPETFFTPADAPASENFKMAAKLGVAAGFAVLNIAACRVADKAERRAGQDVWPRSHVAATSLALTGTIGAIQELRAGRAKRKRAN